MWLNDFSWIFFTLPAYNKAMPDVDHAAQYYLFMKGFKTSHPRLYTKYGLQIRVPVEAIK